MLALCCAMLPVAADAADIADKPFEPEVGQQGKDVVWVPTLWPGAAGTPCACVRSV